MAEQLSYSNNNFGGDPDNELWQSIADLGAEVVGQEFVAAHASGGDRSLLSQEVVGLATGLNQIESSDDFIFGGTAPDFQNWTYTAPSAYSAPHGVISQSVATDGASYIGPCYFQVNQPQQFIFRLHPGLAGGATVIFDIIFEDLSPGGTSETFTFAQKVIDTIVNDGTHRFIMCNFIPTTLWGKFKVSIKNLSWTGVGGAISFENPVWGESTEQVWSPSGKTKIQLSTYDDANEVISATADTIPAQYFSPFEIKTVKAGMAQKNYSIDVGETYLQSLQIKELSFLIEDEDIDALIVGAEVQIQNSGEGENLLSPPYQMIDDDTTEELNPILGPELLGQAGTGIMDKVNWSAGSSALLTNPTSDVLQIEHTVATNPYANQTIFTIGQSYRISGEAAGDGSALPQVYSTGIGTLWAGTSSTTYQPFSVDFVATVTTLPGLFTITSTPGEYSRWRNVSVVENRIDPFYGSTRLRWTSPSAGSDEFIYLRKSPQVLNSFAGLVDVEPNTGYTFNCNVRIPQIPGIAGNTVTYTISVQDMMDNSIISTRTQGLVDQAADYFFEERLTFTTPVNCSNVRVYINIDQSAAAGATTVMLVDGSNLVKTSAGNINRYQHSTRHMRAGTLLRTNDNSTDDTKKWDTGAWVEDTSRTPLINIIYIDDGAPQEPATESEFFDSLFGQTWPEENCEQVVVMEDIISDIKTSSALWVSLMRPIIQVNKSSEPNLADWLSSWRGQGGSGDLPDNGSFRWSDSSQSLKEYTREYLLIGDSEVPIGENGIALHGSRTMIQSALVPVTAVTASSDGFKIEFELLRSGLAIWSVLAMFEQTTPSANVRLFGELDDVLVTYPGFDYQHVISGDLDLDGVAFVDFLVGALTPDNSKFVIARETLSEQMFDTVIVPANSNMGSETEDDLRTPIPLMKLMVYH
jgi:hypothetical protein